MAKATTSHKKYKGVIVSKTDMRKLKDDLKVKMSKIIDFLIFRFEQIGEECVKIARENGSYHDITGNLRSSIGYCILADGQVVTQAMGKRTNVPNGYRTIVRTREDGSTYKVKQKIGGDGAKGAEQGQALLDTLKAKFPWGVVLIVCAGMEYAAYVEEVRHKDVLTSAEHVAEKMVKELLGKMVKSA